MNEWFSHFDARLGSGSYDQMQNLRPDYRKAMHELQRGASLVIPKLPRRGAAILDVACGTAMATTTAFSGRDASGYRMVGLDLDARLLSLAQTKWPNLEPVCADMMRAEFEQEFDLILCVFAYHHVPDGDKAELCRRLRLWSKPGANLLVLEICLHPEQVIPYYQEVKSHLDQAPDTQLCRRFLDWTMQMPAGCGDNSEWKVPKTRLLADFAAARWQLKKQATVWTPRCLPPDAGCFYFQFKAD